MTSSVVTTESILAIDIGTITTRAALFDVVGERYRFIASGKAQTTIIPPFNDVRLGIIGAINQLQTITGRVIIRSDGTILLPSHPDGSGVDIMAATLSAGKDINILAVGLLENVSLESAQNLASQTYAKVTETISMNDRRQQDARIDAILRTRPDLIIVAGGINGGASQSVNDLLEAVGLACYLMPRSQRPKILYAGNSSIQDQVKENIAPITDISIAPNIRPSIHSEQLTPALLELSKIFKTIHLERIFGLSDLDSWTQGRIKPNATSFGRVIRFLSQIYDSEKGVLGIDLGASSTTVASALQGELALKVFPQLGLGNKIHNLAQFMSLDQITYWLSENIPKQNIRDYLFNKAAYPASLPVTIEELAIEQAIARQIIRASTQQIKARLPFETTSASPDVLPWFEMVVASGGVLNHAPTPGQSLLMLLDGLQPTGITTFMLDQNELVASLGVAAEINPLMAVQVLESNGLLNLGTVIAPVGRTRPGAPVLRIRSSLNDGSDNDLEIKFGSIEIIPIPSGQTAELHIQPLHRFDIGMGGPGRGGRVRVIGGELGIVIDARGRPLHLDPDPLQRQASIKQWITTLDK